MVSNLYSRWLSCGVSLCIFAVVATYYVSLAEKKSAAARINTLVDAAQVNARKMRNKDSKKLVQSQFAPYIMEAIEQYEARHGYWKDLYRTSLAIAIHYYHSGYLTQALRTLSSSRSQHPLFINFFDAAKIIYEDAGLTHKVEECKRILKSISHDSGDGLLVLEIQKSDCI